MIPNGREKIAGAAIVQEEDPLPHSPQRCASELISASAALRDVVRQARAHVMDLNIRKRIHGLVGQRGSEIGILSGVDGDSVAGRAANGAEKRLSACD